MVKVGLHCLERGFVVPSNINGLPENVSCLVMSILENDCC